MRAPILFLFAVLTADTSSSWGTGYKSVRAFGPPGRKVVVMTKANALVFRIFQSLPNGFTDRVITSTDPFTYEVRSLVRDEIGNTFVLYSRSDNAGARIHKWNSANEESFDVRLDAEADTASIEPDSAGGLYVLARKPSLEPVSYRLTPSGTIAWERSEPVDAKATEPKTFISRSPQGVYELTTRGAGDARRQRLIHRSAGGSKVYEKSGLTLKGVPSTFTTEGMITAPDGMPIIALARGGKHYLTKLDVAGAQVATIDAGGPTTAVGPATLHLDGSTYKTFSVAMNLFEANVVPLELPPDLGPPRAIERAGTHYIAAFTKDKRPHVVLFGPNGKVVGSTSSAAPCDATFFFASEDRFLGGAVTEATSDLCVFSGTFKPSENKSK